MKAFELRANKWVTLNPQKDYDSISEVIKDEYAPDVALTATIKVLGDSSTPEGEIYYLVKSFSLARYYYTLFRLK